MAEVKIVGKMDNTIDHTFESANRVYDKNGLCPTIPTCAGGGIQPKVIVEETKCVGGLKDSKWGDRQYHQQDRVYKGIAPTLRGERNGLKTVEEKLFVVDAYNKKKIDGEVCGTLTAHGNTSSTHCGTFLIKEDLPKTAIKKVGQISNEGSQCGTVVSDEGLSPTLSAGTHGYASAHVCTRYRIRKLTEKECFRLMGFKDSDFEKAKAVNSATQIYKQAGNSIIRQVLIAIFLQLNIQGIKNWNDRTKEEWEEFYKW